MKLVNKSVSYLIIILLFFISFYKNYAETDLDVSIELLSKGNEQEREYAAEFLGKLKLKKAIPFLKDAIAKDKNFLVRLASVSSLNKLGEPYDEEIIENALQSGNKSVRLKAAQVLQGLSEWKNKEIILNLFADKDIEVRKNIIIAASKLKIKESLDPLIFLLKDPISDTRESAAASLGILGDRKALKPLLEVLEDPSAKVVRAAVISLGEIGDEDITMPMIRMLGHKDRSVRYYAINILGELGDKIGFKAILGMVKDKEAKVRLAAIKVLGKLKMKEYLPVFQESLIEGTDPYVRLETAKSLILLEDYTGYDLIRNEIYNKSTDIKVEAIEILGIIKDKSSVSILKDLFIYPNPEIKEMVIWSLGEIRDAGTFDFLLKKLNEKKGFYIPLADALKKFQDKRLIPYLTGYLDDENFIIRKHTVSILGDFPEVDPEIEKKLVNLLSDEYLEVRQAAIITLVKWGKKIDPELLSIAKNNSEPLQMAAIAGLTELKNKEVIPIMLSLYKEKTLARHKLLLACQLASFGDYYGKDFTKEMAKSEDHFLRKQAAECLSKFTALENIKDPLDSSVNNFSAGADIFPVLANLVRDKKKEVKIAAAKTLGQINDIRAVEILLNNIVAENLYFETEISNSLFRLRNISIDSLINSIKDQGSESKGNIVERVSPILVRIGMPSIDKFIKTFDSKDEYLKINIMNVLVKIGIDTLKPLINYWDGNFSQSNNILVDTMLKVSIEDPKVLIDLLEDEIIQNKALKIVVKLPPGRVMELLVNKLYSSSGMVKIKVIEGLRIMSNTSVDRLLSDLNVSDEKRQLIIIEVLGEVRAERAIAPLEKIVAETRNAEIKEVGSQVITNLKNMLVDTKFDDKSQLEKLKKKRGKISMIEKDYIFANLGWKEGINVGMTFQIFDNNNNAAGKMEITEVVGNNTSIGKRLSDVKIEVGYILEEEVKGTDIKETDVNEIKAQLERLKTGDLKIKVNAISVLGDKGDGSVLPDILYFLEDENIAKNSGKISEEGQKIQIDIRKGAVWAIGEIEYKLVSKIYQDSGEKKSLDDKEQERFNKITEIIVKYFSDADPGVSLAAIRNIIKLIPLRHTFGLKNDFILDPLCTLISNADNYIQRAAIEALAELKDPKSIPFLVNVWKDDDATVRGNVAWALEKIGKPAVPSLKDALKDPNDEKKRSAASVLYKLGYKIKRTGNSYEVLE